MMTCEDFRTICARDDFFITGSETLATCEHVSVCEACAAFMLEDCKASMAELADLPREQLRVLMEKQIEKQLHEAIMAELYPD